MTRFTKSLPPIHHAIHYDIFQVLTHHYAKEGTRRCTNSSGKMVEHWNFSEASKHVSWHEKRLNFLREMQDDSCTSTTFISYLSSGISKIIEKKDSRMGESLKERLFRHSQHTSLNQPQNDSSLLLIDWDCMRNSHTGEMLSFDEACEYIAHSTGVFGEEFVKHFASNDSHRDSLTTFLSHAFPQSEQEQYKELFEELCHFHLEGSHIQSFLSFSVLSTITERLLCSIFLTERNGQSQCPHILTEVLATAEIQNVLGSEAVHMLKCIIGAPIYLNLRNIVWHGFIDPQHEFDSTYTSLMFLILTTVARDSKEHFESNEVRWQWKPLKSKAFSSTDEELCDCGLGPYSFGKSDSFFQLCLSDLEPIIKGTYFIVQSRVEVVKEAFSLLLERKFLHGLSLLLPQFEHYLRRIYVSVHYPQLPGEMLCAQSSVLFTTLDIILSHILEEFETSNQLHTELGEPLVACLKDLFIYSNGFKIRDGIAHHEVEWTSISPLIVDRIAGCFLALCVRMRSDPSQSIKCHSAIQNCVDFHENYVSIHHPKSMLIKELFKTRMDMFKLLNHVQQEGLTVPEKDRFATNFTRARFTFSKRKDDSNDEEGISQANVCRGVFSRVQRGAKPKAVSCSARDVAAFLEEQCSEMRRTFHSEKMGLPFHDNFPPLEKLEKVKVDRKSHPLQYYLSVKHDNKIEDFRCTSPEERKLFFNNLRMCLLIVEKLLSLIAAIREKHDSLSEQIKQRSARTQHRKLYAALCEMVACFGHIVQLVSLVLESELDRMSATLYREPHTTRESHYSFEEHHKSLEKWMTASERAANSCHQGELGLGIHRFMSICCDLL